MWLYGHCPVITMLGDGLVHIRFQDICKEMMWQAGRYISGASWVVRYAKPTVCRPDPPTSLKPWLSNDCNSICKWHNIDGSVQDCSNSMADALELLQSCTGPSIWIMWHYGSSWWPGSYFMLLGTSTHLQSQGWYFAGQCVSPGVNNTVTS